MTARSILEQHKITEDQEWAVYKENLSKRTQLWNGMLPTLKAKYGDENKNDNS